MMIFAHSNANNIFYFLLLIASCTYINKRLGPLMLSVLSAFRPRGVPGPTSKLSLRVPAQMGRRETGHKGGRTVKGNPRPSCCPMPRADGCACSRGLQAFTWERARALRVGPFSRPTNLSVRELWTFLL
jgi:hypothetical protein